MGVHRTLKLLSRLNLCSSQVHAVTFDEIERKKVKYEQLRLSDTHMREELAHSQMENHVG